MLTNDVRQEIIDFLIAQGGATSEGRLDPRGPADADETPARRTPTRARATTPQQVVKARTERERQARARPATPAAAPASAEQGEAVAGTTRRLGRRRLEVVEPAGERDGRPLTPLVPSGSMARVKRRDRGPR